MTSPLVILEGRRGESLVIGGPSLVILEGKTCHPLESEAEAEGAEDMVSDLPCDVRRGGRGIPCDWRVTPCNIRRKRRGVIPCKSLSSQEAEAMTLRVLDAHHNVARCALCDDEAELQVSISTRILG